MQRNRFIDTEETKQNKGKADSNHSVHYKKDRNVLIEVNSNKLESNWVNKPKVDNIVH